LRLRLRYWTKEANAAFKIEIGLAMSSFIHQMDMDFTRDKGHFTETLGDGFKAVIQPFGAKNLGVKSPCGASPGLILRTFADDFDRTLRNSHVRNAENKFCRLRRTRTSHHSESALTAENGPHHANHQRPCNHLRQICRLHAEWS